MLRLTTYEPDEFARAGAQLLRADVLRNNLVFGIAAAAKSYPGAYLALVSAAERPLLAAVMTPPRRMQLGAGPPDAAAFLGDRLARGHAPLPGVGGPREVVSAFLAAWRDAGGASMTVQRSDRLYVLERVIPATNVSGRMDRADDDDANLVVEWMHAFAADINEPFDAEIDALTRRAISAGTYFLWKDPQPVCMASARRPVGDGVAIGAVYTPPPFRRRGYATALSAAISARQLEIGRKWCCLFADAANPTTNRIYPSVGYRWVCDYDHYNVTIAQ